MEQEPFNPAAVNDLETARLALRWALERLHKMSGDIKELKEEKESLSHKLLELSMESQKKDETLGRWKQTIHAWESLIQDHKRMEERLREELRLEFKHKENLETQAERHALLRQAETYKQEIARKEAAIEIMRRSLMEAVKEARDEAKREMQPALEGLGQRLARLEEHRLKEEESLKISAQQRHDEELAGLESRRKSLEEDIEARKRGLEAHYKKQEALCQARYKTELQAQEEAFNRQLAKREQASINGHNHSIEMMRAQFSTELAREKEKLKSLHAEKEKALRQELFDQESQLKEDIARNKAALEGQILNLENSLREHCARETARIRTSG